MFGKVTRSLVLAGIFGFTAVQMTGCAAAHTAIKKRNLDVQTKMSETVFLEPTSPEKHIIFVDIRNTSDKDIAVKDEIVATLQKKGYSVVNDPAKANFMLQANILQVGKTDQREAAGALQSGFGGAFEGAALGAMAGYATHGNGTSAAAGGLIGAALGIVGDALVDDTFFSMITDVQIRERPLDGEVVTQTQDANLKQGTSTNTQQQISGGKMEWKTYRTRVVSTANKVNLDFAEAQPALQAELSRSLSGVF